MPARVRKSDTLRDIGLTDFDTDGEVIVRVEESGIVCVFGIEHIIDPSLLFLSGFAENSKRATYVLRSISTPRIALLLKNNQPDVENPEPLTIPKRKLTADITINVILPADVTKGKTEHKATVQIFRAGSIQVCGPKNIQDSVRILKILIKDLEDLQRLFDMAYNPGISDENRNARNVLMKYMIDANINRRMHVDSHHNCCTLPLEVVSKDVTLSSARGILNCIRESGKRLNLEVLMRKIEQDYPCVFVKYVTRGSLVSIAMHLIEGHPFMPASRNTKQLTDDKILEKIMNARKLYQSSTITDDEELSVRHTFYLYSTGRFTQHSRNYDTRRVFLKEFSIILRDSIITSI